MGTNYYSVRHRIDPENRCVGHGEGTYDYITGRYS